MRTELRRNGLKTIGFEYALYDQSVNSDDQSVTRGTPMILSREINVARSGFDPLALPLNHILRRNSFVLDSNKEIAALEVRMTESPIPESYIPHGEVLVTEVKCSPSEFLAVSQKREVFGRFVVRTATEAFQKCRSISGFPYHELIAEVADYEALGYRYYWDLGSKKLKSDVRYRVHAEMSSEETLVHLNLTCPSIGEDFSLCVYRERGARYVEVSGLKHVALSGGTLRIGRHFAPYELHLRREHFSEQWAGKLGISE